MTTTKRRINISADNKTESVLVAIARRDKVPVATKAAELLRWAIEFEEDTMLTKLAEERMSKGGKMVPHHLAWK